MFAEITFFSMHDLPTNYLDKLKERISANCELDEAIASTELRGFKSTSHIRHWQKSELYVFLMYEDDSKRFKVHVENIYAKGDLGELKRHVEETTERFQGALKDFLYGKLRHEVTVFAEGTIVLVGHKTSCWERLKRQLIENWPTELYVPVASLVLSLVRGVGADNALTNAGIAIVAMMLWIIFEVVSTGLSFEYKEA